MTPGELSQVAAAVIARVRDTAASAPDGFPMYADPRTAEWTLVGDGFWTGGFWAGSLWLASHASGDPDLQREARSWTARLAPLAGADTVLRGLLFWYGAGVACQLSPDTATTEVADTALAGARGLARAFRPEAQLIPQGNAFGANHEPSTLQTNIDGVAGTAALLGWAADVTGDRHFREVARSHITRHVELCVRSDGSVCQAASVDPDTGMPLRRYTQKGFSDTSTWARAQAWAMLAFAQGTRWVSSEFGDVAVLVADWWLDHQSPELAAPWDFDDPAGTNAPRDTSASAIAACALSKLAGLRPETATRFLPAATKIVATLVARHVTPIGPDDARPPGMLLDGCYHHRAAWADAHELIWGDYFLMEAVLALTATIDATSV